MVRSLVGGDVTLRHAGWLCVLSALALSMLGIYIIDVGASPRIPGIEVSAGDASLVPKQVLFLCVGVVAAVAAAVPHCRNVRLLSWPAMVVVIGLLVFLLLPGVPRWLVTPRNGARAWINLGPLDFQPGEVAKIAFVLVLADYFRYRSNHRTLGGLLPPALITLVPVGLITLEPDLGTALLFVPCLFAMLLAAGARLKHLAAIILIGALAGPLAYPLLKQHQQQRIVGLINMVQGNPEGSDDINYQSLTAVRLAGAGGLTGLSDAKSRAVVHFNRLPERHNDMIFAVIVNRFGLAGGVGVLALYGVWMAGALLTAASSKDPFGRLIVVGFAVIIATQMYINIGMNLALLPIIGLTLPFVSYGGSSMLTVWVMTGLVFGVGMRPPARLARPTFEFGDE
ncbi:MAG: FtsW/RodA/SpoVE family cell cycle protein [Phycisphaerales bacterium]